MALGETLKRKARMLLNLDEEILESLTGEDEISSAIEESEKLQVEIQTKITEIDVFLTRVHKDKGDPAVDRMNAAVTVLESARRKQKIKLPDYEIKKFSGDPKEYRAFWDAFSVAIGENEDLSSVEKFTYLKNHLLGEAAKAISGLTATSANYTEAVAILKQRFGNKQVIVNSHMAALTKIPKATDPKDTKKIRQLYDEIEGNLRSLKALGIQPDQYGFLLVSILLEKLPATLNLHLSRKFNSNTEVWNIKDIMEELRKELEARERCNLEEEKATKTKFEPATLEALLGRMKMNGERWTLHR